ncbi:hypothetical protein H2248_006127 [Termitomyces sp. 'cryptogamus']|nr:hypothetical protein H2248_006127 [Termitomyces sp. 'cryptogamus']
MRTRHTPHSLSGFPVYSSAFLSENELVLGGGGGTAKAGIKNKLRLFHVGPERSLEILGEVELNIGEDAPMSMAADKTARTIVCGVNSTIQNIEKGSNENCRVYTLKDNIPVSLRTRGTIPTSDPSDYQASKVTVLSSDGTLLAVAGAHDFSLLFYPSLSPAAEPIHTENEIYDATFSGSTIVVVTTRDFRVYSLPSSPEVRQTPSSKKSKGKGKNTKSASHPLSPKLELLQSVDVPTIPGVVPAFRSARYHPTDSTILYTTVNTTSPRTKKAKTPQRQSFIYKWDTKTWTVEKSRKVGDRALTCFDISPDGKFLGYGTSDLTVGLFDAGNLSPLVTILKAHDFPPTTIAFNPTSTLLITGSADASVRVVSVPTAIGSGPSWTITLLVLLAILVVLLAIPAQRYLA